MKTRLMSVVAGIMFILFGCSVKEKSLTATIQTVIVPQNNTVTNPFEKAGIYKGEIFYSEDRHDSYLIHFLKKDGTKNRTITFKRGKAPGQVGIIMAMTIRNDMVYMYDLQNQKIILAFIDGTYKDEFLLSEKTGLFGSIAVTDRFVYYHALIGSKLSKIDYTTGDVIKSIDYIHPPKDYESVIGKVCHRGALKEDPFTKKLYISYFTTPFTIEVFDAELTMEHTLTRELPDSYEQLTITPFSREGNFVISSLSFDEEYIYACFGGGQKIVNENGNPRLKGIKKPFYISVFSKKTKKLINQIVIPNVPYLEGNAGILGVDKDSISIQIVDMGDTLKNIKYIDHASYEGSYGVKNAILVIRNPMYQ